jgi:hypothetical protein
VNSSLHCITINGHGLHVEVLEGIVRPALDEFYRKYLGQVHHTTQHNLKVFFSEDNK